MASLLNLIAVLGSVLVTIETQDIRCGANREFRSCGTACPRTCDNFREQFLICTRQCVPGCFCVSGLVEKGTECVPSSECSVINPPTTTKPVSSTSAAVPTSSPTVRNSPATTEPVSSTSASVPTSSLPPVTSLPVPTCSGGKVYKNCGSACPSTCENMLQSCDEVCVAGCFCPSGLVDNGTSCVMPNLCDVRVNVSENILNTDLSGKIDSSSGALSTGLLIGIVLAAVALFMCLVTAICGTIIAVQRKRTLMTKKDGSNETEDRLYSRANVSNQEQTIGKEPEYEVPTTSKYEVQIPSEYEVPVSSEYAIPAPSNKYSELITMNKSYNCTNSPLLKSKQERDDIIFLKTNEAYAAHNFR